jgi:hypothetical protein
MVPQRQATEASSMNCEIEKSGGTGCDARTLIRIGGWASGLSVGPRAVRC